MRPLAFLIALLLLAQHAFAEPPRVNGVVWIGDLELHFDANRWAVNGADTSYDIYCQAAGCSRTTIAINVTDEASVACTPEALTSSNARPSSDAPASFSGGVDRFSRAGLTFLVAEGSFGCRNLAGGPVHACTSYSGRTYLFDAPGEGCQTRDHAGKRVNEVLQGLRPR